MPIFDRLNVANLNNWLMDAEHRQLIILMNEVELAIGAGKDETEIRACFDKLVAWATMHFEHEADSIRRSGYVEGERHIAQHGELVKALTAYAEDSAQEPNRRVRVGEAVHFLEEWLVTHIEASDAPLAAYLSSKGMT